MATRPLDGNMSHINPQIRGASETAGQLKIDQKLLEKVLAKQGLSSPEQLAKMLGPEVLQFFRTMSEGLNQLCGRMHETEVKTLHAQYNSPKVEEFVARDTSKGNLYQERLPENFITVEKLSLAAKTGLLTTQQSEALKNLFGLSQEARAMRRDDVPMPTNTPQSEQERGQGGQHRDQHEQDQSGEDAWADFSTPESTTRSSVQAYTSQSPNSGNDQGGDFSGGSLRSSMRRGMGGGMTQNVNAPPPPPPPPPPGNYGGSTGSGSVQMPNQAMGTEQAYLDSNFSADGPFYNMFETLFGSENWYRSLAGNALGSIQKIRDAKQKIMAELAGLDPTKPADAKQLYILQQQLGEMQQSERQYLDNISAAQKANNERKEYIKSILDIFFQTNSAIIRNLRQ